MICWCMILNDKVRIWLIVVYMGTILFPFFFWPVIQILVNIMPKLAANWLTSDFISWTQYLELQLFSRIKKLFKLRTWL